MATKPQGSRLQITLVWQDVLPRKRYLKKKKKKISRKQNIVCSILSKDVFIIAEIVSRIMSYM